jgi:hypothetical protein
MQKHEKETSFSIKIAASGKGEIEQWNLLNAGFGNSV